MHSEQYYFICTNICQPLPDKAKQRRNGYEFGDENEIATKPSNSYVETIDRCATIYDTEAQSKTEESNADIRLKVRQWLHSCIFITLSQIEQLVGGASGNILEAAKLPENSERKR